MTALKIIIVKYPLDSIFLAKNRKKGSMVGNQEVRYSSELKLDKIKESISILLSVYSLTCYLVIEIQIKREFLFNQYQKLAVQIFKCLIMG
jgi:hypothetical protein